MLGSSGPDEPLAIDGVPPGGLSGTRPCPIDDAASGRAVSANSDSARPFLGLHSNCTALVHAGTGRDRPIVTAEPPLPDARLIRRIIRQRQLRERFFDSELFTDPVWDMLLDLVAATSEQRRVSVSSLCLASRVPSSTALRWIGLMTVQGLLRRVADPDDRRRAFAALTDEAVSAISRYFESLGADAELLT